MFDKVNGYIFNLLGYSEEHKKFFSSGNKCPRCSKFFWTGISGLDFYSKDGEKLSPLSKIAHNAFAVYKPVLGIELSAEFAECPECSYRWSIYDITRSNTPTKSVQQDIRVHLETEIERVRMSSETVLVPSRVKITVKRSRTVEHTVDISWRDLKGGDFNLGSKDIVGLSIKGEIEKKKGRSYKESETIEYEVELNGEKVSQYNLVWTDILCKGFIEFTANNTIQLLSFRFRESSELEVIPMKNSA